jgi:hypothetical protein
LHETILALLDGLSVIIFHVENTAFKIADQLGGLVTHRFVYFTRQAFQFLDCHKAVLDAEICVEHGKEVNNVGIFDFLMQVKIKELIHVLEFGFCLKIVSEFVFVLSDGDCEELK